MCKSVKSVLAALCGVTALAALPAEVLAGPMSAASSNERWTNDVVRTSLLSGLSPRLLSPRLRHSGRRGWRSGWRRGRRGRRFGRGNCGRIGLRLSRLRLWRRSAVRAGSGTPSLVGCGAVNKTRAWSCAAIGREAATATGLAVNRVGGDFGGIRTLSVPYSFRLRLPRQNVVTATVMPSAGSQPLDSDPALTCPSNFHGLLLLMP